MADEENGVKDSAVSEGQDGAPRAKGSLLPWIILGVVVPLFAGAGFGLGRLLAGAGETPSAEPAPSEARPEYLDLLSEENPKQKSWYFQEIDPIVATLADPGATRYLRAGFMLEMSGALDATAGAAWLTERKPLIKNWLALYLAGQSVADLQGERNLNRVLSEIRNLLNERLFPDAKPPIMKVLLNEFAIQ